MKSVFRLLFWEFFFIMLCLYVFSNPMRAQWVQSNGPCTGLSYSWVYALAVSGTNIFAGTSGGGVYLSTNNGISWTQVSTGLADTNVLSLAISDGNLFAGTYGGVCLSTDNGTSWNTVNTGLPTNALVHAFVVSGTNLFAATDYAGINHGCVFLSTDIGASWSAVNTGLPTSAVVAFAISGTNIFAGAYGGVFLSTNNGTSWTAANTGLPTSRVVTALAVSGTNLFAGTDSGGVFLSTDNGTGWTKVSTGLTNNQVEAFAVFGTNLFAGTGDGVFLSTNNGTSWTAANAGLTSTAINALAVSGTNLFAGTCGSGVWQRSLSDILPMQLASFSALVKGSMVELQWTTATEIDSYGFEIERNMNNLWTKIGFVAGNGTSDSPKEYSFMDNDIPSGKFLYRLKQIDRDGQFKYSQSVEATITATPTKFALDQNYPNPFNPSTTINYDIQTRSHVTLSVFNALGQRVNELVNGEKEAGSYDVTFDASGLASGMYLYRMQAGRFVQTRKLVVIK